jgi:hypothetical protein
MFIKLSPLSGKDPLSLTRAQDALIVNGLRFDFADLPEGGELPAEAIDTPYISGTVARTDGQISLTIRLPFEANAPRETKFPEPITADLDGPIDLPPFDIVTDEEGNETEAHGEPVDTTSDGIIDWSQMTTPDSRAEAALDEWRETASVSKADFCIALASAKVLTPAQAVTASQGGWPEPMRDFLDTLTEEQAAIAQIEWASSGTIHRSHEFIDLLSWWLEFSPEQVDQLFGRDQ